MGTHYMYHLCSGNGSNYTDCTIDWYDGISFYQYYCLNRVIMLSDLPLKLVPLSVITSLRKNFRVT